MTRNSKALGLALVAILTMAAVAASAAQATKITTAGGGAAILTGESVFHSATAGAEQTYTTNSGAQVHCNTMSGRATVLNNATSMTFENVVYGGCVATLGSSTLPATVIMTGCDYFFHTTAGQNVVDLICPVGTTGPDVNIYLNAGHTELLCTLTVSIFNNHTGISYTNVAGSPDDIKVVATEVETPVKRDGSILCSNPTSAKYTGTLTMKAYADNGGTENGQIGVTVE